MISSLNESKNPTFIKINCHHYWSSDKIFFACQHPKHINNNINGEFVKDIEKMPKKHQYIMAQSVLHCAIDVGPKLQPNQKRLPSYFAGLQTLFLQCCRCVQLKNGVDLVEVIVLKSEKINSQTVLPTKK